MITSSQNAPQAERDKGPVWKVCISLPFQVNQNPLHLPMSSALFAPRNTFPESLQMNEMFLLWPLQHAAWMHIYQVTVLYTSSV